jgi:hypothetical protein
MLWSVNENPSISGVVSGSSPPPPQVHQPSVWMGEGWVLGREKRADTLGPHEVG